MRAAREREREEVNFELEVQDAVKKSIREAIEKSLSGYSSPLEKLIKSEVDKCQGSISMLINESIMHCMQLDIREQIREALSHKLARLLVTKMEGELEKKVNDLRSSPETRARIVLAIDNAIKEIGKEKGPK